MAPIEPRPHQQPGDPALLRVSDADRHKIAEIIREAAGEGRLDFEELDERLEATYAAKTYADLDPITVDLPMTAPGTAPVPRPATPSLPAARHDNTLAMMGSATRRGVWEVGERHTAFAMWAGIDLALREARFAAQETVIYANAIWAGIDIIVNEHTNAIVEGVGIMGAFDHARDKVAPALTPDSPTVRVKGVALMAAVTVVRKPMPGESVRGFLRRR
ncbi:MAG: DUF1707 SHOCT-like domain-containing protein [Nocardioides sp.]